jgi:hypothetical protein
MATGSPNTVPPKNPAPKPAAANPPVEPETDEAMQEEAGPMKPAAANPPVEPETDEATQEEAGPIVERITIGSLVVKKTVYDDGDMEMTEVKTIKRGPDENFKSWRYAQPA